MLFISHSAKDKAEALDIQRRLLERGYDAAQLFLDSDAESGIPAGSKWEQVLYARLKGCRALIVLCSENWQQSKWCFAELVYAKAMGKEVFPVLLEACDIGGVAGEHQGVLVYKEGEAAYARLWAALESRHLGPHVLSLLRSMLFQFTPSYSRFSPVSHATSSSSFASQV